MIPELPAFPAHRVIGEEGGMFEAGCSLVGLNWCFTGWEVGKVMLMTGVMVKPEAPIKLSPCIQQAILLVLPGGTPKLHSEEYHANQSTNEKRSVKRENWIFFVVFVRICALCIFILHPFILYMDQEHHPY